MHELLPWHRHLWERLMQARAVRRLPHALLCTGSVGLGKDLFVQRLAHVLFCGHPASDNTPCGVCQGCRLMAAGSHPDYIRIEPSGAGKIIKIDQIRELCTFLGYTSQFGGYKIAVVISAERMNTHAANSLLKTLEEPPAGSLLLLVTTAPFQLPPTVRSRCQKLIFTKPEPALALAWLTPRVPQSSDPAFLLGLAGDAPLAALSYAEEHRLARRQALFRGYGQILEGRSDPVHGADSWVEGDMVENLGWLIGWHMDMIRLKMTSRPPRLINPDLRDPLVGLAAKMPVEILFRRLDEVLRLQSLYITSQVNPQLMLEAFFGECAGG